jgi:hypothetical protein
LKIFGFGTLVVAEIRQGVWSEVSLEKAEAQVLGKEETQELEEKTNLIFQGEGLVSCLSRCICILLEEFPP